MVRSLLGIKELLMQQRKENVRKKIAEFLKNRK